MKKRRRGIPLSEVLEKELKNPEFRFYFEQRRAIREIANLIREARKRVGLTQTALAKKADTTQTVIARLESATDSRIPSLDLLQRIASALKARLLISFDYRHKKAA